MAKVIITIALFKTEKKLAQQWLLVITDKSNATTTTKEELMIEPITSITTILIKNSITIANGENKRIVIRSLVKNKN